MTSGMRLETIELFSELNKKELKAVSRLMTSVNIKAGRDLMVEGQAGREFLVILEGEATVRRAGRVLAKVGQGDFLGCLLYTSPSPRDQRGSRMPSSA